MIIKKEYLAPSLRIVEFNVELGFVGSSFLSQGFSNSDDDDDDDDSDYEFYHPGSEGDWD